MQQKPRVVIVGAGFGGLTLARTLRKDPLDVVLIDRTNYHKFQPLLYQVATAGLEPEEIAHAVRGVFQGRRNLHFRMATVTGVDFPARQVRTASGALIPYDYLVLAAGAETNYFGVDGAEAHSFPLKDLHEAVTLRAHIIRQFERADRNPALIDQEGLLNFVVTGGGPTGVEMAGALLELFQMVLRKDYPDLPVDRARVILIEMADQVLTPFDDALRQYACQTLTRRGAEVWLGRQVVRVTATAVHLSDGTTIPTRTLIWAAGVKAPPLADALGLEQTGGGRVVVEPDLSVPGHPEVFILGDMAASRDEHGRLHPQLAPVAIQGARHVAEQIRRRLRGEATQPFRYTDKGIMATIGRNAAVAEIRKPVSFKTTGFLAWLMWLGLHLIMLIGFRNRLQVLVNWTWNYFTYDRSARLILDGRPPDDEEPPLTLEPESTPGVADHGA
ncbi:FAD-dependent oxidoreductase [Rhodothermaceae bacterium RA]|nr:FAD-dependent oxidoreductase [Rhodothermaceae bacterium RA]